MASRCFKRRVWRQRAAAAAAALQRLSETRCDALNPLEGRNEDSTVLNGVNWEMRLMENTCQLVDCSSSLTLFQRTDTSDLLTLPLCVPQPEVDFFGRAVAPKRQRAQPSSDKGTM